MSRVQVTCIEKRGNHFDPHERIKSIGGAGWKKSEDDAIRAIENGTSQYFVNVNEREVDVIVATHEKRKYLKTKADDYSPNNLLSLKECS